MIVLDLTNQKKMAVFPLFKSNISSLFPAAANIPLFAVVFLIGICCQQITLAKSPKGELFEKGEIPVKLAGNFKFTEGPACDKSGNIFFTDQPNNRIMKWSPEGKLSVFKENSGHANGTYFDRRGNLVTCSDEKNEVWSIAPDGKVTVLVREFEGKRLNGPNDLWIAPDGGIYLTDPFYKRSWWDHEKQEIDGQCVYYLAPNSSNLVRIVSDLEQPNGIIGTLDGKYLYVADIKGKKTWRYLIARDGLLTDKKLFADQGSDGMTIDNQGNIYMTGNGVTVYDADGKLIVKIPTPESWTTNVCFGGKDRHLLFITTETSIFGLKMKVKGVSK